MRTCKWHRAVRLGLPNTAPFAGLFLVLGCFFLLTSTLKEPTKGLVSLQETPYLPGSGCFNVPDHTQILIYLTTSGHVSFAASDPGLQWAIIEQVGEKYGVHFSAAGLVSMAYLDVRFEVLSAAQARPTPIYPASRVVSSSRALTEAQLLDCIETARALSQKFTKLPVGIYVFIDAQTQTSLVMHLVTALQERNSNQLNLLTHN